MRTTAFMVAIAITWALAFEAHAQEGPPKASLSDRGPVIIIDNGGDMAKMYFEKRYRAYLWMKSTGVGLFASSFAFIIGGVIMIEGSPYGGVGSAGLALVGVGLVHFIASVLLLGFSRTLDTIPAAPVPPPRPTTPQFKTSDST